MPLWLNTHLCPLISSKAKQNPEISLLYVTYRKRGYISRPHVSLNISLKPLSLNPYSPLVLHTTFLAGRQQNKNSEHPSINVR